MPSIINATTSTGLVTTADNSGSLQLATNSGTTALTIDTSQNVGIGVTNPSSYDPVTRNLVVGNLSGNTGITISSGSSSGGYLTFADGTTGTDLYDGIITYSHASRAMTFYTAATDRMRIDSAGRVTTPYQPMASVTKYTSGTNTGGTYEMVYDSVQVNIGSHYNNTNGRFTCPVAGTYRISAFGMGTLIAGNWNFFVSIRKNGNQQGGTAYNYGTSENYKHASGNWLITCAAGDYVSIWGGGNGGYYGDGYAGATFELIG